jgi:Na+/H+ antiporter NhaD/arsenite permease-like protein
MLPYLIALVTSANIGSVATLVGNPQNMIIGHFSHLAFDWNLLVFFAALFIVVDDSRIPITILTTVAGVLILLVLP